MKKENNKANYIVDEKGSIGLLAIGYKGIRAWRKKKIEIEKKKDGKEKR